MPVRPARALQAIALALAATACQPPAAVAPARPADVRIRALAADDAATRFDAMDLGLLEIRAIAALPDGGALLATEGGLWRYGADGQATWLAPDRKLDAALVPDGRGGFLTFNRRDELRRHPAAVTRLDVDGKATPVATFMDGAQVRAVAPGPDGSVRALLLIIRQEGGSGRLAGIEASVWEAKPGGAPTKLRDLPAADAQAIGVAKDEQATGVDAAGRFVIATGRHRAVEPASVTIGLGLGSGPPPQAAPALVPAPEAMVVRLDPLDGGVAGLEADGHRVAVDGRGNRFGLDAATGALTVRADDDAPTTLLGRLPGPSFPRQPAQELAIRAALGADGVAFLAPELGSLGADGLPRPAAAPKATTLMRVAKGEATAVMGAVGGQQGVPKAGAFDLIEPAPGAPYFMTESAVGPDGRIALAEGDQRVMRVVTPGKGVTATTWPERHAVIAVALAGDGVPWIAYSDNRLIPAPFPANLFGKSDVDDRLYLGRLLADGTIEKKATLVERRWEGTIERIAVRADGSAFATRVSLDEKPRRELLHVSKTGVVKAIWRMGEGRDSASNGNYNTPGCSMGLAKDGALEIVAGTQHARVAAGKTTAEDLPDLPVDGAYPAIDPAGRLHVASAGPTVTRVDGPATEDALSGLFSPAALTYRLRGIDATGFDATGNLYIVDRQQQRLFRVPAGKLPK